MFKNYLPFSEIKSKICRLILKEEFVFQQILDLNRYYFMITEFIALYKITLDELKDTVIPASNSKEVKGILTGDLPHYSYYLKISNQKLFAIFSGIDNPLRFSN